MSSSLPNSSTRNRDNIKGLNRLFDILKKEEENENEKEEEEENYNPLETYEKFLNKKLLKCPLLLKIRDSKIEEKIYQMDNGGFIVLEKDKKVKKNKKPKEEIISQNIESVLTFNKIKTKYKIVVKDNSSHEIYSTNTDDINPSFFEIKEDGFNFAIICENNNLHKILINNSSGNDFKNRCIDIKMKIFLILQISDIKYIISCDKGTYYYGGLISNICPERLTKISGKSFKKGINLGKKILIFLDNEYHNGYLYKLFNGKLEKLESECFGHFILESLTVINYKSNNIILCAYKENHKQYGIALIRESQNKIQIYKIEFNFIIQFICPLKNIIKDNNNILSGNNNTKIVDTEYIIIVGENKDEVEMGIYKIKGLDNLDDLYPTKELVTYLSNDNIVKNLEEMSFIIQSRQNGNLIVGNYDKKSDYLYFEEND